MFQLLINIPRILFNYYKLLVQLSKYRFSPDSFLQANKPNSWEFSVFSQNGEDGITDFLIRNLLESNKYFVEIGASNAIENNTSYLAFVKKFSGLMIDGDKNSIFLAKKIIKRFCIAVDCLNLFVDKNSISFLKSSMTYTNPDVFSLDIDGNDFYLAKTIIESGIRPKIFIVEYNSAFGPEKSITIEYNESFNMFKAHPTFLYYGVSINGWRKYFESIDYKFVTVDSNGVNGFFIDKNCFNESFIKDLDGLQFKENFYQLYKFKGDYNTQFNLISDQKFQII